jgi:large subunit ribosomal protein L10
MALSKEQKNVVVEDLTSTLQNTKITVFATCAGVSVQELQTLRRQARESGTTVKVAKNRLFKQALASVDAYKSSDTSSLTGQLLFAFNNEDEVAPAQVLNDFAKKHPSLQFVGAYSENGDLMDGAAVKQLATLPSKDQLRGQLVGTIAAPLSGFVNVLAGNMRGLVNVLNAHKEQLN